MNSDPEIEAMSRISQALGGLDRDARERVLAWADQRFVRTITPDQAAGTAGAFVEGVIEVASRLHRSPSDIVEAISRASETEDSGQEPASTT